MTRTENLSPERQSALLVKGLNYLGAKYGRVPSEEAIARNLGKKIGELRYGEALREIIRLGQKLEAGEVDDARYVFGQQERARAAEMHAETTRGEVHRAAV